MCKSKILSSLIIFTSIIALSSCGIESKNDINETVDSFSVAYFNWNFKKAIHYVTPASEKWISYAASQVTEEDVDSLRAMQSGAEIDVKDIDINDEDSTATAEVEVSNFMAMDSIGKPPYIKEKATFHLPLSCDNGIWKIALKSLP